MTIHLKRFGAGLALIGGIALIVILFRQYPWLWYVPLTGILLASVYAIGYLIETELLSYRVTRKKS